MTTIAEHLNSASRLIAETATAGAAAKTDAAVEMLTQALRAGKPMLVCGNGGSAADAQHITCELVGRFLKERKAIKCICLADNAAVLTAWSNDHSYATVFSRQVEAYAENGGVLLGLSTSGNSENVVKAFEAAKKAGMLTIAMTGAGGGKLADLADILIDVPSRRTPDIQQVHLCLYHYICEKIEANFAA